MDHPEVLVVGETPSLGRSITDLLVSGGVPARFVGDVRAEAPLASLARRFPVVVAASNSPTCSTAREWVRGELPDVALVVVGSRDPILTRVTPAVHVVSLPLLPSRFLELIRELMAATRAVPS
ncbi:MAG: hypothetical protein WB809_03085 [Thermoplasmata archaeon]